VTTDKDLLFRAETLLDSQGLGNSVLDVERRDLKTRLPQAIDHVHTVLAQVIELAV
jgi:hypothetical protein